MEDRNLPIPVDMAPSYEGQGTWWPSGPPFSPKPRSSGLTNSEVDPLGDIVVPLEMVCPAESSTPGEYMIQGFGFTVTKPAIGGS